MALDDIPSVVTGLLSQYMSYKAYQWSWESWVGGTKPTMKVDICKQVNALFYDYNKVELAPQLRTALGWRTLLPTLVGYDPEDGELNHTLHAIRNFCIKEILESELKDEFLALLEPLREDAQRKKEIRDQLLETNLTEVPVAATKDYFDALLLLSYLGDYKATLEATPLLFADYQKPPEKTKKEKEKLLATGLPILNPNIPYLFNPVYHVHHYLELEKSIKSGFSFADFVKNLVQDKNSSIISIDLSAAEKTGRKDDRTWYNKAASFFGRHPKEPAHFAMAPPRSPSPGDAR